MPIDVHFDIPFDDSRISPDVGAARAASLQWVLDRQLVQTDASMTAFRAADYADMVARFWPDARGDALTWAAKFYSYGFLMDDQFPATLPDRAERATAALHEQILLMFRAPGTPLSYECPITVAYHELWADMAEAMPQSWLDRFGSNYGRYLAANVTEIAVRKHMPDLRTYIKLRRWGCGMFHVLDMAELVGGFQVPPQVMAHPLITELRWTATDAVAWMNDVHSVERDLARGETNHNLVLVLAAQHHYSHDTALADAITMTNDALARYSAIEKQIPTLYNVLGLNDDEQDTVRQFLAGCRHAILGYYDWATTFSSRYVSDEDTAADDLLDPTDPAAPH